MSCTSCGSTLTTTVTCGSSTTTSCAKCSTPCTPSACDPCASNVVATPLVFCDPPPEYCTDGCVDTQGCNCVIYRGPHLGALNLLDGDTLCMALANLNATLTALIGGATDVPNFVYTVRCALTGESDLSLTSLTKNGVSQISSSVQFANGLSAWAYLQTIDTNWVFTAPNVFSIQSPDTWTMTMGCPS